MASFLSQQHLLLFIFISTFRDVESILFVAVEVETRKNLFNCTHEHIEILHADETQAINNEILAELELDELTLKCDLVDAECQE